MKINPKDVQRMTHAAATVRKWTHAGQQAYLAQQSMPNLSATVYNYVEYHADRSGQSAGAWDLSQRTQITFNWAAETRMMWPNPQGVGSTTIIRLQLADGALVDVTATGGGLSYAGAAYAKSQRLIWQRTPPPSVVACGLWLQLPA